jgi:hypothetical protein
MNHNNLTFFRIAFWWQHHQCDVYWLTTFFFYTMSHCFAIEVIFICHPLVNCIIALNVFLDMCLCMVSCVIVLNIVVIRYLCNHLCLCFFVFYYVFSLYDVVFKVCCMFCCVFALCDVTHTMLNLQSMH